MQSRLTVFVAELSAVDLFEEVERSRFVGGGRKRLDWFEEVESV